ncbi:hypothetical protein A6U87_07575 [Rhizobium sp. AC44/96]|uniref:DUF1214 domain-containing protein n=1 Tax=unclassified Rhizobium TaxID=2613769 RepID=UPI00080F902D|nr:MULTISPECIES: DUF1214 domain-containing protein [unclassified Rhizobium]OCJ13135.1 hypothetical protein A6U87_07575 [Rhizobium sp. AC44/96]
MENVGAKYREAYKDADGEYLSGDVSYRLHLQKDIPAHILSVTVYDPITSAGLDNGQPFPSLNTMDKPVQNADGTTDIYVGPKSPGADKNWLATIRERASSPACAFTACFGILREDLETRRHRQDQVR